MYILYLDDSGSAANAKEQYFVLGGVCIPEKSIRWLAGQLDLIAQEIYPLNPQLVEFHAAEIFNGRSEIWKSIPDKSKRIEILKKVLNTLKSAKSDTVTFACAVHKTSYPDFDPVLLAFEELSNRFDLYLQRIANETKQEQRGLVVLDKSSYETGLQNLASTFRKEGNRWGNYLHSICEVPFFVDSKASRIIQLADHIAYAVFRRYNALDLTYFNCIEGRFDTNGGVIHGLVHRQTYNRSCTCPACISRRRETKIQEAQENYKNE